MSGLLSKAWLLFAVCAMLPAVGCSAGSPARSDPETAGPERTFMMGFSTLPRQLNADSYADAFRLSADHGEIVLIQRTPPWDEFLPGSDVNSETAKTTASEKDAIASDNLKLFFAIDPTDSSTGRDRLAGLPASLANKSFSDPQIRTAFAAYAKYVALNYRPAYLALGVEMNLYLGKHKDDIENFRSLYIETAERVKEVAPDTQVTLTFQYEDLLGKLPTGDQHFADWPLFQQFEPASDVIAISTYPSFAFSPVADMPEKYYRQLRGFTDKPIVFAEIGYSSAPGAQGGNNRSEQEQAAFLRRALREASDLQMPLVIWFAAWDPSYAAASAFGDFRHIGLLRDDGSEKPAWAIWEENANRRFRG